MPYRTDKEWRALIALAREEAIEDCAKLAEAPTESGLRVPNAGRIADRIRSLRAPAATVRLPSPMPDGGKDESYIASGIFSPPGLKAMAGAPAAKEEHAVKETDDLQPTQDSPTPKPRTMERSRGGRDCDRPEADIVVPDLPSTDECQGAPEDVQAVQKAIAQGAQIGRHAPARFSYVVKLMGRVRKLEQKNRMLYAKMKKQERRIIVLAQRARAAEEHVGVAQSASTARQSSGSEIREDAGSSPAPNTISAAHAAGVREGMRRAAEPIWTKDKPKTSGLYRCRGLNGEFVIREWDGHTWRRPGSQLGWGHGELDFIYQAEPLSASPASEQGQEKPDPETCEEGTPVAEGPKGAAKSATAERSAHASVGPASPRCLASTTLRTDEHDPGKWRSCERTPGHTGRHGAHYCGKWETWSDWPASPAPDRAALVERVNKAWRAATTTDTRPMPEILAEVCESVLRERAAEQGEADCLRKLRDDLLSGCTEDTEDTEWERGVHHAILVLDRTLSKFSAPQATGTSTGEPSCPTCGATSREDKLGQFCSNAYHAPAQPTPDVFERFGEQCGRDWVAACERHEEGRTGTQRIGDAARARFGPLVEALEWYRDQTDTPGMARAALARLRQEGG